MEDDDFISKTRRKKQSHDIQSLGVALTKLSAEQLARFNLPETLLDALIEAKRFTKHEAVRRHAQYIGRIMREMDVEPIAAQLAALNAPTNKDTALFHLAERWRTDLMADPSTIPAFAQEFPGVDERTLADLIEAAKKERDAEKPPKHFRELFHVINNAIRRGTA